VALGAAAAALAACGGSQPVARGYGSTELEPIRDSTIFLSGLHDNNVVAYSTELYAGGFVNWWTLDLTTGAVQSYGTSLPPFANGPSSSTTSTLVPTTMPPTTPSPFTCTYDFSDGDPTGTFTLKIVDTTTNVETDIHDVVTSTCPGADGTLDAFILNANGGIELQTGPYTQLMPAQLTVGVLAVLSWTGDGVNPPTSATVVAAPVTAPNQYEIDSIDLAPYYDVTVLVPGIPVSAAWAAGATPVGSLQSTSVAGSASSIQLVDGHFIYARSMSDGGTTLFAGPFSSGASELALFEIPPGTPLPMPTRLYPSSATPGPPKRVLFTWTLDGAAEAASNVVVWDDTDLALAACPKVAGEDLQGVLSTDGSKALFSVPQSVDGYYGQSGPLDLLTLGAPGGAASCQQLVASDVVTAAFSPDAQFIFWLTQPPTGQSQLWIAASDGTGARMIGSGEISAAHFIGDGGARLEMILGGELDWMDLHDATGALHHVAEQVHGSIYDILGGHWLIMGYQWNATDGTATLALINRDDGTVRPISPSVTDYEVLVQEIGADGGAVDPFGDAGVGVEYIVVYVVRGRNPSPQDGIWRATITQADLQ
jgi:hypothetical protein